MWVVKYTSTAHFTEKYGFSLVIRKPFRSECEAIDFINQVKKDDKDNNTYRTITLYESLSSRQTKEYK